MNTIAIILAFVLLFFVIRQLLNLKMKIFGVRIPRSVMLASASARPSKADVQQWDRLLQLQADGELSEAEFLQKKAELIVCASEDTEGISNRKTIVLVAGISNKIEAIKAVLKTCRQHNLEASQYIIDHLPQVLCSQVTAQGPRGCSRGWRALG